MVSPVLVGRSLGWQAGCNMKRKYSKDNYARKADRKVGFVAFPIINVVVWFVSWLFSSGVQSESGWALLLPWVANGLVLVYAFIFRPEFAVGYLVFIAFALGIVFALGFLFLGGCFLAIGVGAIFSFANELAIMVAGSVFVVAFIAGLIWIGTFAKNWYDEWLAVPIEKNLDEPPPLDWSN